MGIDRQTVTLCAVNPSGIFIMETEQLVSLSNIKQIIYFSVVKSEFK